MQSFKFLLLGACILFSNAFAYTKSEALAGGWEATCLGKIMQNQKNCIAAIKENKIFLRPENIVSYDDGIYLYLNETEYSVLPLLLHCSEGYYLEVVFKRLERIRKDGSKGLCPNCDQPTDSKGICRNNECFFRNMRVL